MAAYLRPHLGLLSLAGATALSTVVGLAVAAPRGPEFLVFALALVLALAAVRAPAHVFLALSVAVLASSAVSEAHPWRVGASTIYTSDLMLVLVLLRAALPRPRFGRPRLLTPSVSIPLFVWCALSLYAGAHGWSSGNTTGQVARLETSFVYFVGFSWGFTRIASEVSMSIRRTVKWLVLVTLGFVAFALYARLTHQRFGPASGYGIADVVTTGGVLRRDYGLFTAFELYPILSVCGLAYLFFVRRPGRGAALVTCIAIAATLMTLVRGMIFGVAFAAVALGIMALRERGLGRVGRRLIPVVILIALAAVPFSIYSTKAAMGVAQRSLPFLSQSQDATHNAQFRVTVLRAGERVAGNHAFGLGFVSADSMTGAGYPPLFIPHSQWGTLLALEGWPGALAFSWLIVALVLRSRELGSARPWLHPMVVGLATLVVIEGFAWNLLFSMVSGMGMLALFIGLRFGTPIAATSAEAGRSVSDELAQPDDMASAHVTPPVRPGTLERGNRNAG